MSRDGKKTGGRDFPKGVSGNPKGAQKLAPEVREFRKAAKAEIIEEFKYLWSLPIEDLRVFTEGSEVPAVRVAIAKAIVSSAETGDMHQLNQILDRVIGKVKTEVDLNHSGQVSFHTQVVDFIEKHEKRIGGKDGDEENEEVEGYKEQIENNKT